MLMGFLEFFFYFFYFYISLWIVAKLFCHCLCLVDKVDKLHAMNEILFNDFLIGSKNGFYM